MQYDLEHKYRDKHLWQIVMIVAKALDGQRYPMPQCEYMRMCDGDRGSGPEGADDLCLVSLEA